MSQEEAIEIINRNCTEGSQLREACAMFIPELKESEDERIREIIRLALIASEDELSDFYKVHNISRKECTDWLEKQKESLHIPETCKENAGSFTNEDERIRKALLRCCDDWEKGQFGCMAKEDIPAIRAYLEKQKEQPMSAEDELHIKPRWKPSEEYFQGLRRAIRKVEKGSDAYNSLTDLYEQLKKL